MWSSLELLFERPGLPAFGIPQALAARYGGDLGFATPRFYANFVASVDGVVAVPTAPGDSGRVISGNSAPDRFVMALLRACADAVLIGAGTFRKAPGHLWHAERVFPSGAAELASLRKQLGLSPTPLLVLITASGDIDTAQPALRDALVVTTRAGEARLSGRLAPGVRMAVFDSDTIPLAEVLEQLGGEGRRLLLTEGGPSLVGRLVADGLLHELFLTTSPALFGRYVGDGRKSLIEGAGVGVAGGSVAGVSLELLSVRRQESHLFLRYALPTKPA